MGRPLHPTLSVGPRLLSPAARQGERPPRCSTISGGQVNPHCVPLLGQPHALRRADLSQFPAATRLAFGGRDRQNSRLKKLAFSLDGLTQMTKLAIPLDLRRAHWHCAEHALNRKGIRAILDVPKVATRREVRDRAMLLCTFWPTLAAARRRALRYSWFTP